MTLRDRIKAQDDLMDEIAPPRPQDAPGWKPRVATVIVDGRLFTGQIYHTRSNGWQCVETEDGTLASGPEYVETL